MNTSQEIPDYLKDLGSLSDTIGTRLLARLSPHKSGKFVSSCDPQGLISAPTIQLIDVVPGEKRVFYAKAYSESIIAPDCFSGDGISPSPNATSPQSDKCENCHKNEWGSAKKLGMSGIGTAAKACKTYKRVLVLIESTNDAPYHEVLHVLQIPVMARADFGKVLSSVTRRVGTPLAVLYKLSHVSMSIRIEEAGYISKSQVTLRLSMLDEVNKHIEHLVGVGSDANDAHPPEALAACSDVKRLPEPTRTDEPTTPDKRMPSWVVAEIEGDGGF